MAEGKFLRLAKRGLPLEGETVIDAHTHVGGSFSLYHIPFGSVEGIVEQMDRLGIKKICAFSFAGVNSDFALGNDQVMRAVKEWPERIVGYATVNANYPGEWIPELERCRKGGLRGIKIICEYQGATTEGTDFAPLYGYANDNRLIMINHNWGRPEFLDSLAERYSEACFIIGHCSTRYVEVLRRRKNVYQCTCAALMFRDVENLLEAVKAEKIVYGSDMADLDGPFGLAPVLYARIGDEEKRMILGLNMQGILDRYSA
ncbi:MAG: amidohydrolase family protein [Candidatus Brockarchaeota archaeon]|nr:amidohydrolase family protein [Candidatus Brockarchaeota archaeon]